MPAARFAHPAAQPGVSIEQRGEKLARSLPCFRNQMMGEDYVYGAARQALRAERDRLEARCELVGCRSGAAESDRRMRRL